MILCKIFGRSDMVKMKLHLKYEINIFSTLNYAFVEISSEIIIYLNA